MRCFLALLVLFALYISRPAQAAGAGLSYREDVEFLRWRAEFYDSEDENDLARIYPTWRENADYVQKQNSLGLSYTLALNKFAHLKASDVVKKPQHFSSSNPPQQFPATPTIPKSSLPPSVSWKGICGPPYNQNECGAPPLVTTNAICAWHTIKTGFLIDFSTQELMDCCCTDPTSDCQCQGYEWKCVIRIGGLCTEEAYPYGPTGKCHNNTCTSSVKIHGAKYVQSGNETALQVALVMQPVATIVDASHASFQFYAGGVYNEPDCSSTDLDHMMLIEGYGTLDGVDYWLVKNSWGTSWGMEGYILMSRNKNNQCGIATMASYPY